MGKERERKALSPACLVFTLSSEAKPCRQRGWEKKKKMTQQIPFIVATGREECGFHISAALFGSDCGIQLCFEGLLSEMLML